MAKSQIKLHKDSYAKISFIILPLLWKISITFTFLRMTNDFPENVLKTFIFTFSTSKNKSFLKSATFSQNLKINKITLSKIYQK
jgi:hypothetical protein